MNPLRNTTTVSPDGSTSSGSAAGVSGYTIIEAVSLDAAVAVAKDCPFLGIGGFLEVSEPVQMGP